MSSREEVEQSLAALDAARAGPDADAEIEALEELEAAVRANLGMFRPEDQQRILDETIARLERGLKIERQHDRFLLRVAMERRDLQARAEKAEAEVARLRAALEAARAEIVALRDAMFKTYCAAANEANYNKLIDCIEGERTVYEQHHTTPLIDAALSAEPEGEVVWDVWEAAEGRWSEVPADRAALLERKGFEVRAIRVIATTTKEPSHE